MKCPLRQAMSNSNPPRAQIPVTDRGPLSGESWEKLNVTQMRLHEHFANAGGVSEVAIDLKRRMRIEQVADETAGLLIEIMEDFRRFGMCGIVDKHFLNYVVSTIGVAEPSPEGDFPRFVPTGGIVGARGNCQEIPLAMMEIPYRIVGRPIMCNLLGSH
jgi:hypothetical protein